MIDDFVEKARKEGRIKTIKLAGHKVRVIVPGKSITIEEGLEEIRKIFNARSDKNER